MNKSAGRNHFINVFALISIENKTKVIIKKPFFCNTTKVRNALF